MTSVRNATSADADTAAPLIYASGPGGADYVFGPAGRASAIDFFRHAFGSGRGEFGYPLFRCAESDGQVLGVAAGFGTEGSISRNLGTARQIIGVYGLRSPGVLARAARTERITPPPTKGEWYIAHVGVSASARGQGIGSLLIDDLIDQATKRELKTVTLDVAVDNPAAQRLYERIGFVITEERISLLTNDHGTLPSHRRMAIKL